MDMKRTVGAILIAMAGFVGFYFVASEIGIALFPGEYWRWINYIMVVGIVLGLVFAITRKRDLERRGLDNSVTREYLEANVLFYAFMGVTLLFLWNWFNRLAGGDVYQDDIKRGLVWIVLDTVFPLIAGAQGIYLWRGENND